MKDTSAARLAKNAGTLTNHEDEIENEGQQQAAKAAIGKILCKQSGDAPAAAGPTAAATSMGTATTSTSTAATSTPATWPAGWASTLVRSCSSKLIQLHVGHDRQRRSLDTFHQRL